MPYWKDISSALWGANKLWLPPMSLDFLSQTHSLFKLPFDIEAFNSFSKSSTGWADMTTVTICYPDSWALDQTLDGMALRLSLPIFLSHSPADCTIQTRFKTGSETAVFGTSGGSRDTITKTYTTIPTGPTDEIIEWNLTASIGAPGTESATCNRSSATLGPDCLFEFYEV